MIVRTPKPKLVKAPLGDLLIEIRLKSHGTLEIVTMYLFAGCTIG